MLLPHSHVSAGGGMPFYPKGLHDYAGFIFIAAAVEHAFLNRKALVSYLKHLF